MKKQNRKKSNNSKLSEMERREKIEKLKEEQAIRNFQFQQRMRQQMLSID